MKSLPVALPLEPEIDKEQLYGEYMARERWRDKLQRKASHKALDILDSDGTNIINGISGKHLLGVGAMVLAGVLGWQWMSQPQDKLPNAAPATGAAPAPQEYDVSFWVDGEEITVTEPEG